MVKAGFILFLIPASDVTYLEHLAAGCSVKINPSFSWGLRHGTIHVYREERTVPSFLELLQSI
jgi:hypothetical protein